MRYKISELNSCLADLFSLQGKILFFFSSITSSTGIITDKLNDLSFSEIYFINVILLKL